MMKNKLTRLLTTLCLTMPLCVASAATIGEPDESENMVQNVSVTELDYTLKEGPKSELGTVVGAVLDVLADQVKEEQPGYVDAVRATVIGALSQVRRFTVTDGLQVTPSEQTNLIVDGTINYISTTRELKMQNKKEVPQFYAQICVTLNLKDAGSGNVLNTQMFEINRTSWSWFKSTDSAIKNALEGLHKRLVKYYDTAFPYSAHILERGTEKKDKQKEIYIDLGAANGLQEGTHFDVYVLGSIGGKETRNKIGRLKVSAIEGDEVSRCKVTSGGRDIKDALDTGKKLLIISTD